MDAKEYEIIREEALGAFRKFILDCGKRGFTVQHLDVIRMNANRELDQIISDIHKNVVLTEDLLRPLQ